MSKLGNLNPHNVFRFFEEISAVPRGSGDMKRIADYCENFALSHNLKYVRDTADNVVIYKEGTCGRENLKPVILQGHLDMVCQKTAESTVDFTSDGIELVLEGDRLHANGTTLGADNGIAVAMILAILESNEYAHPPIEAVFTVDEEVGMLGAVKLDMDLLSGDKMINLDSEEDTVTVSCAGGEDFYAVFPTTTEKAVGTVATLSITGLKGGHSGIEINKGRVNADMLLGRFLNEIGAKYSVISLFGGDKANAIPNNAKAELLVSDRDEFMREFESVYNTVKAEISHCEPDFCAQVVFSDNGEHTVLTTECSEKVITVLTVAPCGVMEMSAEIPDLVETSLNLGILKTDDSAITMCFSLRSNKSSAQAYLAKRLYRLFGLLGANCKTDGFYPPWEYKANSQLEKLYCEVYRQRKNKEPQVVAIHAGLECAVFSSRIQNLECISIGPEMKAVHTVEEELSVASVGEIFKILLDMLKLLK